MNGLDFVPGSFRDPAGFVYRQNGVLYRQVNASFRQEYEAYLASGLRDALVAQGLLIPEEDVQLELAANEEAHHVLRPEPLAFVSYPYEWCFSQLKQAALTTLVVQEIALDHGMTLRDASAYNIQFRGADAVLIDTLSFEQWTEGRPWVAYRQFCQHFLAPLALMAHVDVRLGQLLRVHLDGVPLDLASSLLPVSARWRPALFLHIRQHAKSQARHADASRPVSTRSRFTERAFRGLIDSLASGIRRMRLATTPSAWSSYYEGDSYSEQSFVHKKHIVGEFVGQAAPDVVWDLGANTGQFSQLAAERAEQTIAFEQDHASVEEHYLALARAGDKRVLPLVVDLTNPSPAIGWANVERGSLATRGPADLVMALALVHHLAIGNNVPLERIASYLRELGRWLIIEFVPKSDPKTQLLLDAREDVFSDYGVEAFEEAFSVYFDVRDRRLIDGTERTVYLMRRH